MKKIVCLMLLAGMLGACNATREDLGLERKVPDASKVSEQKQLLLPPNYDLRPVVPRPLRKTTLKKQKQVGKIRQ